MKIVSRYLMRNILVMTVIVSIAFLGISFFVALANQFHDVGKGDYSLGRAMWYVCLIMPHDFYQIFPIAGLLGCLLALGLLANHSELTVMRTAGLSVQQIIAIVLLVVIGMTTVVTVVGEYYAPRLLNHADRMRALDKNHGQAVATQHGIWLRDHNDFVHVGKVAKNGELSDITRFSFDDTHHMQTLVWAEKATYKDDHWTLRNVQRSQFQANQVTASQVPEDSWNIHISPSILRMAHREPEEMTLRKLYQVMQFKQDNKLEYIDYALPFWQRILQPLATCVMLLLAVPFIFGPLRQVSMGLRIMAGLLVGFSFYLLNQFFVPFSSVFQVPPFVAAILPTMLCFFLGVWLMRKTH